MSLLKQENPDDLPKGSDLAEALHEAREDSGAASLDRRNFMRFVTASFAALSAGGCDFRPPREEIVPRLTEPEHAATGVAQWYASTCGACPASCGVLAKTREGRPIKLEGNPDHPLSQGGLCARGQASVLDLYDSHRLKGPRAKGEDATWARVDSELRERLQKINADGRAIVLLTSTLNGTAKLKAVDTFRNAFEAVRHVTWDAMGASAIREAYRRTHGEARLPRYRIGRASVVVGLDADFLGTWLSPVEFMREWADARARRVDEGEPFYHIQFESRLSVTGANADRRFALRPSRIRPLTETLLQRVLAIRNERSDSGESNPDLPGVPAGEIDRLARRLVEAKGSGLVLCGSDDVEVQIAVSRINAVVGREEGTVDLERPSYQFQGRDSDLDESIESMRNGEVGALIVWGCNPAHAAVRRDAFREALEKVDLKISLSSRPDETSAFMDYQCPDHHALEAWGDSKPAAGWAGLTQPAVGPLHRTRSGMESLLRWADRERTAYDFLRETWEREVFPKQDEYDSFEPFWTAALKQGGWRLPDETEPPLSISEEAGEVGPSGEEETRTEGAFEFVAYASPALYDGSQANNPWLQELPDPISKVTWGNPLAVAPADAQRLGLQTGDVVRVTTGETGMETPVLIQPGMPEGVVAGALGYGRKAAGPVAANWPVEKMLPISRNEGGGADFYPLRNVRRVRLEVTDRNEAPARTQVYDHQEVPFTGEDRNVARSIEPGASFEAATGSHEDKGHATMWAGHTYDGHKWSMSIDLNRCTGCSACVIACQAENNIPVVGKLEVGRQREMHWLRLDRYYSGSETEPDDQPDVSFQPMLCQHCDHAPCETVCPVLATVHNDEGLNVQVYNRCIGTRFCANNCPYKVRRFNWFDYARDEPLQNLVLNPDVTVRSRGVMEKCTFCVQRINRGKRDAAAEGRPVEDGDVTPACAQSCPARAIVFGDINDPESRVHELEGDPRGYHVLEELGTKPSVRYLARVNLEGGESEA